MSEIREGSALDHPSKTFLGVQFVLIGFDPIHKIKVLSKLVDGGGVDVGQYGHNCTHVIVDQLIYDDPICVRARTDGKTLVTSLWVDHSFDVGMPINPSSIVYRPLKDLKGIPGAKSLIVCLTGYQRQDRDDIMTMVGLIGANFSRPLVANKVTHLICFKFEGEKYELAKKTNRIKLVNHRWLQDCLRAWEILSETDYYQSGYKLEIMEAVAKDSEDTPEAINTNHNGGEVASPYLRQPISKQEVSINPLYSSLSKGLSNNGDANNIVLANLHQLHSTNPNLVGSCETRTLSDGTCGNDFASTSKSPKRSPCSDESKKYAISYSRKKPRRTTPPMLTYLSNAKSFPKGAELLPEEEQNDILPGKRKRDISSDEQAEPLGSKMFGKKFMRCRRSLCVGNTTDEKGSVYLNNSASQNDAGIKIRKAKSERNNEKTEMKGIVLGNNLESCVKLEKNKAIPVEYVPKADPVLFILSGNRLQRKEFHQVIRSLKGRVCRDSHQWSYQATHFIVPYPIRRTEKFCAAAASGRWILKSDYITASKQEGRFLAEEPYEWHQNGLSEDGAINLEAPKKWRLLREKTGHGAFYGMRIIIYGDCIVPPLDTLKRFVKAGDGTILATSPPYSRFLKSGVDFAIVSAGMPCGDIWVEEFLRHEIPCVVADYLVEYVCKPGYSLERHVQFNSHVWADKSFRNLVNRMEEISEDAISQEDSGSISEVTLTVKNRKTAQKK